MLRPYSYILYIKPLLVCLNTSQNKISPGTEQDFIWRLQQFSCIWQHTLKPLTQSKICQFFCTRSQIKGNYTYKVLITSLIACTCHVYEKTCFNIIFVLLCIVVGWELRLLLFSLGFKQQRSFFHWHAVYCIFSCIQSVHIIIWVFLWMFS